MANLLNRVLSNQFRIDAFIASGGMGAVYRVWDLKRNVPLAMKVLHADLAEDPAMFKRFKREAHALKKLAHPNIVPFYGLYETPDFAFLLERYVDGPSLKDILRKQQGSPLPMEEVLIYLKALSAALGYAHANGVVHCDVKPGNVMVDKGGNVYLTDFGIARHSESTTTTLATSGTAAYMAPEQIRGEPVSAATDIYALGVMLYEMLTGQRPFKGDERGTESGGPTANERIRYGHLTIPPPDPRSYNPAIPEELALAIFKSLHKSDVQRYKSAHELFIAMCMALQYLPEMVPDRILNTQANIDHLSAKEKKVSATPGSNRNHPRLGVVIGLSLLPIAAILFFALPGSFRDQITEMPIFHKRNTNVPIIQYTDVSPTVMSGLIQFTDTTAPSTFTPQPLISTPISTRAIPIFLTPTISQKIFTFTATQNLMCRRGPETTYEHAYDVLKGETYGVMAKWSNGWLLLKILNPRVATRTGCCWVRNIGTLVGNYNDIRLIDYWIEEMRITCDIR